MARQTKPLTDTEIKATKSKDADYHLHHRNGLSLLIKSSGSKLWQFRYYRPFTKLRTKQSFGAYPSVTLSDARKLRAKARALLANSSILLSIKKSSSGLHKRLKSILSN